MNVLLLTDENWDNFAIIKKRISYLEENTRVNVLYTRKTQVISNMCAENMLHILRRTINQNEKEEDLLNLLKIMDYVIIFHNFTEYNNPCSFIKEACEINKIPIFIFSEAFSGFLYNDNYLSSKFKKCISEINKTTAAKILKIPNIKIENYSEFIESKSLENIINSIRHNYNTINSTKETKSIKFLYDRNENKSLKQIKKQAKEMAYLDYSRSKSKWIKEVIPKS
tara:strand:- start:3150 stop:3824 length:675 start_codon:yes stop_codon:yes gene_type:complete